MVGPLVLNGLRNSSIVSLQAGLVLSWFLKRTGEYAGVFKILKYQNIEAVEDFKNH